MTEAVAPRSDLPLWRRALPFGMGLLLVGWVAHRIDWDPFRSAVQRTNSAAFFGFAVAFYCALWVADVLATTHVYRKTIAPVRFRELLVIRAASYLPSLLNHHLGQAWLTYFLSRAYRAPLGRTAGA